MLLEKIISKKKNTLCVHLQLNVYISFLLQHFYLTLYC